MKAIILSAFVLLASMMPVDAVAQQSATTNFGVDRVLDGVKLNVGIGSLFVNSATLYPATFFPNRLI